MRDTIRAAPHAVDHEVAERHRCTDAIVRTDVGCHYAAARDDEDALEVGAKATLLSTLPRSCSLTTADATARVHAVDVRRQFARQCAGASRLSGLGREDHEDCWATGGINHPPQSDPPNGSSVNQDAAVAMHGDVIWRVEPFVPERSAMTVTELSGS